MVVKKRALGALTAGICVVFWLKNLTSSTKSGFKHVDHSVIGPLKRILSQSEVDEKNLS